MSRPRYSIHPVDGSPVSKWEVRDASGDLIAVAEDHSKAMRVADALEGFPDEDSVDALVALPLDITPAMREAVMDHLMSGSDIYLDPREDRIVVETSAPASIYRILQRSGKARPAPFGPREPDLRRISEDATRLTRILGVVPAGRDLSWRQHLATTSFDLLSALPALTEVRKDVDGREAS